MPPSNPRSETARHVPPEERGDGHQARFPADKRRHEEETARREQALAQLHDERREEAHDPRRRRHEAQAAERHEMTAARHQGRVSELGEAELHERSRDTVTVPSKGALITYRVLLPLGLIMAGAIAVAGLVGLSSPGILPVGTAVMALGAAVVVNAIILFALLLSLRAGDDRVRQVARVEAARYANMVREEESRREERRGDLERPRHIRPQVNMVEYHKVEVRPRRSRTTTHDDQYQTQARGR